MKLNTQSTVVVSGGTGALGRVVVSAFLAEGFRVAIPVMEDPTSLKNLPTEWAKEGARLLFHRTNLAREEEVAAFVDEVSRRFSAPGIVVNTAGGFAGGSPVESLGAQEWTSMIEGNLTTAFYMCKHTLGKMKENKYGRIVNIAAMPAVVPSSRRAAYAVAKRGVVTLTESISEETRGLGITANAIAPSIMVTPANIQSMPDADRARWVTTEEVAALVLFLSSDDARSISGNTIKIFGGV